MKFIEKHNERVEKVRDFTGKNKVFTIAAVIIVIFILIKFIGNAVNPTPEEPPNVINNGNFLEIEVEEATEEPEKETWRFYFIDLWILGIGGGFCFVMILRERKKTREGLK